MTKNSMKERYKTAQTYLQKLRFLIDDVGHRAICDKLFNLLMKIVFIAATLTA